MARYEIEFRASVEKELKGVPRTDRIRILKRIDLLCDDPRPTGCKKLSGQERYRIRLGDYRILYEIVDQKLIVTIVRVGNRRDAYQ